MSTIEFLCFIYICLVQVILYCHAANCVSRQYGLFYDEDVLEKGQIHPETIILKRCRVEFLRGLQNSQFSKGSGVRLFLNAFYIVTVRFNRQKEHNNPTNSTTLLEKRVIFSIRRDS